MKEEAFEIIQGRQVKNPPEVLKLQKRYEDLEAQISRKAQDPAIKIDTQLIQNLLDIIGPAVKEAQHKAEEQSEKREADKRQKFALQVLELLNQSDRNTDTIQKILHLIKEFTQFDAVAIRLKEEDDFPFYASLGFSEEFINQERYLCVRDDKGTVLRNPNGLPYLEGLCGRVLSQVTDSELPFYSDKGSFWINSAAEMFLSVIEECRSDSGRGSCLKEGYESLALIPLMSNGVVYGLLHLCDRRKGVFTSSIIRFFEGIGASVGVALARKKNEDMLRRSEEKYRVLAENAKDGIYILAPQGFDYVNPALEKIFGYPANEILGKNMDTLALIHPDDVEKVKKERMIRGGKKDKTSRFSFRIIGKDGRVRHAEVNTVALPGDRTRVLGILRDVTDWSIVENELKENILQMENMVWGTVQALAQTTETRDPYTSGHQNRVARLALAIAEQLGLEEKTIDGIRMAGLVHDIGKIQVPAEILGKPGKLTEMEFNLIKVHPQVGYDILKTIEFPFPVARTVLQHHERMDGSGYPFGLKGDQILLEARILAVSDVVEAMASYRPYRPALGLEKALEEIQRNKETFYDADVVNACLRVFQTRSTFWGQPLALNFTPAGDLVTEERTWGTSRTTSTEKKRTMTEQKRKV